MAHLEPGRVLIVAGGTGIYPFSDLIDLLYKDHLQHEKPQLAREIQALSPILANNPFGRIQFHLLAAFNNLEDIHPITSCQLAYLASRGRLGLTLKIKDSQKEGIKKLRNAKIISDRF